MRYSIVNDERAEAQPGLKGVCHCCGGQMIAKCGQHVVWHWAHKSRQNCDAWWESETEWHRSWKDCFPIDWQEVVHADPITDERHIADVKTPYGLVIEIQNSPLRTGEMRSREQFYGNMVWIVNGDRRGADGQQETLDRDYFRIGRSSEPIRTDPLAFAVVWYGKGKLLHNWNEATKDVYFDFADGILWKLDSFDPNKVLTHEERRDVEIKPDNQGDLFPESRPEKSIQSRQIKRAVSLGVFIPIRIDEFVTGVMKNGVIDGTFGPEEASIFRKCLVPYSELTENE